MASLSGVFTGLFAEAWAIYRRHAGHLLTITFVVYVVAAVLQAALAGLLGTPGALLAAIVGIVAASLTQAALVKAAADIRDGRADRSWADPVRTVRPVVGRVVVASILASVAGVIGLVLLIAPGLYLLTIWYLIVPVIVLEGASVGASFRRSRELVRGFAWDVFFALVLVSLLYVPAVLIDVAVLAAIPDAVGEAIGGPVSATFFSLFQALVLTTLYFRLLAAHGNAGVPRGALAAS
jgi:hypothetical protein